MIHYHGLPITPATAAAEAIAGGHAFISHSNLQQLTLALEICQSNAFDNGAFAAWSSGKPITNWTAFYDWIDSLKKHPTFDFAVIPDVIDGDERSNDMLLAEWPHERHVGAPVWHMHESITRLRRLCEEWPRVCLGSSGEFSKVGTSAWWQRMTVAMDAVCGFDGYPICKLHGLRMLNPKVFCLLPLSSADSTNIGRNIGIDKRWQQAYAPPTKEARARLMRQRIEHFNGAQRWHEEL